MSKLTPKEQAAIKWWNKLPQSQRIKMQDVYGVGRDKVVEAYEDWSSNLKIAHDKLDDILRSKP